MRAAARRAGDHAKTRVDEEHVDDSLRCWRPRGAGFAHPQTISHKRLWDVCCDLRARPNGPDLVRKQTLQHRQKITS